jgi:uncharacterized protein (DUF2062 family)
MFVLSNIRHRLDRLAASDPDPGRTAAAIAVGVFLSFSPFLGLQILIGLGAAVAFRLSRVAVLVGLCANLPWIMVPWYVGTTAIAATLIGSASPVAMDVSISLDRLLSVPFYDRAFWNSSGSAAANLFWPFLIGPTIGALVPAAAAYAVSYRMLLRRHRRLAAPPAPSDPSSARLPGDA